MSQELLYTSAPSGLRPGSRGFCTVACTAGMSPRVIERLESLSGYRQVYPPHDPNVAQNPVVWSHLKVPVGGQTLTVLARIGFAGLDYSERANKLAHHLVLEPGERPAGGPAWVLSQPGLCESAWDGQVGVRTSARPVPGGDRPPGICHAWQLATGDAGWAGVVAQAFCDDPRRPIYLVYDPGRDMLGLIVEALALLPAGMRWDVTFSTYFTHLPQGVSCAWRCVLRDSPEAEQARRVPETLVINVGKPPLVRAGEGRFVEAARTGIAPVSGLIDTSLALDDSQLLASKGRSVRPEHRGKVGGQQPRRSISLLMAGSDHLSENIDRKKRKPGIRLRVTAVLLFLGMLLCLALGSRSLTSKRNTWLGILGSWSPMRDASVVNQSTPRRGNSLRKNRRIASQNHASTRPKPETEKKEATRETARRFEPMPPGRAIELVKPLVGNTRNAITRDVRFWIANLVQRNEPEPFVLPDFSTSRIGGQAGPKDVPLPPDIGKAEKIEVIGVGEDGLKSPYLKADNNDPLKAILLFDPSVNVRGKNPLGLAETASQLATFEIIKSSIRFKWSSTILESHRESCIALRDCLLRVTGTRGARVFLLRQPLSDPRPLRLSKETERVIGWKDSSERPKRSLVLKRVQLWFDNERPPIESFVAVGRRNDKQSTTLVSAGRLSLSMNVEILTNSENCRVKFKLAPSVAEIEKSIAGASSRQRELNEQIQKSHSNPPNNLVADAERAGSEIKAYEELRTAAKSIEQHGLLSVSLSITIDDRPIEVARIGKFREHPTKRATGNH